MNEIDYEQILVENEHCRHNNMIKKDYEIELLVWESKIMTISYFGDIALWESCPRTATVIASTPTDLIVLHKT